MEERKLNTIEDISVWQDYIISRPHTKDLFLTEQQVLVTLELAKQIAAFHQTFKAHTGQKEN